MRTEKDLRRFLSSKAPRMLFIMGVVTALLLLLALGVVGLLLGSIFWLYALLVWLMTMPRTSKTMKQLRQSGQMEQVLRDFSGGKPCAGGKVYLGSTYIIGKGFGFVCRYDELVWLYRFVTRFFFFPIASTAMAGVRGEKKPRNLCPIPPGKKGEEAMLAIAQEMAPHNPQVLFGYSAENHLVFHQMAASGRK